MTRSSVRSLETLEAYSLRQVIEGLEATIQNEDDDAPKEWRPWVETLFPFATEDGFAGHHCEFWDWAWSIEPGTVSNSFCAFWPRGGAKSSSAEMAVVSVGARRKRKFVLYVSETQDQANDHVANIAELLESELIGEYYPALATRKLGKYGQSKGWNVSRLRCSNGFNVVALGLDSAARGIKLDKFRPDLIVLDDIDGETDTPATTKKKIKMITQKILPAGSKDAAVLFIQNLVSEDSIASQLADGRAEFLADRYVSGPIPALEGFEYEKGEDGRYYITAGTPTWSGQDFETCQAYIWRFGITAFERECQHDVSDPPGGIFSHLEFSHCEWTEVPEFVRTTVWCDPAVTATDDSDSMGIQADALGVDGKIYRLWSWEDITTPEDAIRRAIEKAIELKADSVGIETDQGGDTWESVFARALEDVQARMRAEHEEKRARFEAEGEVFNEPAPFFWPVYKSEKAGSGYGPKSHRAQQQLTDYERGLIVHVIGTHRALERALYRFPAKKPYDLVDASFWSWNDLRNSFVGSPGYHEDF